MPTLMFTLVELAVVAKAPDLQHNLLLHIPIHGEREQFQCRHRATWQVLSHEQCTHNVSAMFQHPFTRYGQSLLDPSYPRNWETPGVSTLHDPPYGHERLELQSHIVQQPPRGTYPLRIRRRGR